MSGRLSVDQILFPSNQNLSDNANMLDHYEEGSFTPYWSSSGVTAPYESNLFTSSSYEAQKGFYIRIGGIVLWQVSILMSNNTAPNLITYANGGANGQDTVLVIDDIFRREGNLFSAANDPANTLRLWGGAQVNYVNALSGSGWNGFQLFAYGPTQYDSASHNGTPGVIFFKYLGNTGEAISLNTTNLVEAGNHFLVSGQYVAEVNNFGTK